VAPIVTANPTGKAAKPSTNMYVLSLFHIQLLPERERGSAYIFVFGLAAFLVGFAVTIDATVPPVERAVKHSQHEGAHYSCLGEYEPIGAVE
jgi:hypothetical protein